MSEYISREKILDIVSQYCPDDDGSCSKADVDLRGMLDEIEALPAANVQPVKHGRWMTSHPVDIAKEFKCTACGGLVELPVFAKKCYYDFCPNCGARMIKDGDTECQ